MLRRFGVVVTYFDGSRPAAAILAQATERTRLILMESPGSLTFEFLDVPAVAGLARDRGVLTLLDNTWGAGVLFKPLAKGVDISVQALTKYVGGHADVFGGAVAVNDPILAAKVEQTVHDMGWTLSPDDAYLLLRGLRTLELRLRAHEDAGFAMATWLKTRPEVARVLHPALPDAPGHNIWKRDYAGANGLFGVVLRPGPPSAVAALLDSLRLFGLGFSWGGFESLAINADPQLRNRANPRPFAGPLLRLHIGLEPVAMLQDDLARALDAYAALAPET
jgi:cystathionine beta-lyase